MRKLIGWTLAGSLAASSLAGCGRPAPMSTRAATSVDRRPIAARAVDPASTSYARQFYEQLHSHFAGAVTLTEEIVTVTADASAPTVYDFSAAQATHQVRVHTQGFDTTVDVAALLESELPDPTDKEILPLLVLPIAIELLGACVQSLAIYAIGHHGAAFDKGEAIKAMAVGMGLALIPFMGEVKYAKHLVPIATKILGAAPAFDAATIARAALPLLGELVVAIRQMLKERKTAHDTSLAV